ncbi:hypothetical protein J5N97_023220 [Dioscorea zingiberensis]|uniref:Uncharacterized protein n=1 Tax=Dioscorea zingiberensis TaxID=325984 RepID=A0A9D5CCL0_9LILI|nr:hypothetical protein J5N97_023220 [Dioscorea zingiberensis]
MEADFSLHSGTRLAAVANRCLVRQSKMRPKMSEVLDMVQRIVETRETGAPELPLKGSVLNETTPEEKKKKGLNLNILEMPMTPKRSGILKSGEGRKLVWHGWTPKFLMIMYEEDPDVVRWGLHLLHGDPFSYTEYCEMPIQNVVSFENGVHTREGNIDTDHTNVENDGILAHALQEELSQVAAEEASQLLHA